MVATKAAEAKDTSTVTASSAFLVSKALSKLSSSSSDSYCMGSFIREWLKRGKCRLALMMDPV